MVFFGIESSDKDEQRFKVDTRGEAASSLCDRVVKTLAASLRQGYLDE